MAPTYVLVTGATGFIGAHVVDNLLSRGFKVRCAVRSIAKGEAMKKARPQHADKLDFIQVQDFEDGGDLVESVQGVDGVIHVASPFKYNITDNEKELVLPAINGVKAILSAVNTNPSIKRVVITSSFAAVLDATRTANPTSYFTFNSDDWNPLTYEEATDPKSSPVIAYRGSKKFAERAAWEFLKEEERHFDIVTLCPPMVYGPIAHPVEKVADLNESNNMLWQVAAGSKPMPVARVPFWIDVRDLAFAHVEALLRPEVSNKRFTVASPERFGYGLARNIIEEEFPWAKGNNGGLTEKEIEEQKIDQTFGLDGEVAGTELGVKYRPFRGAVIDLVRQVKLLSEKE